MFNRSKTKMAPLVLLALASCERQPAPEDTSPPPPAQIAQVPASDELPKLPSPATGIAFWSHPALSFNSLMVVATEGSLVSYNIENGNEVGRIDGINANGAELAYYGFGPRAIGAVVTHDHEAGLLRFYGVHNENRSFIPLTGGPEIRGAVRSLCAGRAIGEISPTVFVVQREGVQFFTLTPTPDGVEIAESGRLQTPDNLTDCAVDVDGALIVIDDKGDIFKILGEDSFTRPLAATGIEESAGIIVMGTSNSETETNTVSTRLIVFQKENGAATVITPETGGIIGSVTPSATDEIAGITNVSAIGATSDNLGGLYRNGVIAYGADGEEPSIVLLPVNGLMNALSLPDGGALSPRGQTPEPEDNALNFETGFQPE